MLFTELFNGKDNCAVCGQTPCNCTHVTEEKVRLDPKCWKGKKIGNPKTKVKGGVRVNNCVPAESVAEGYEEEECHVCNGTGEGRTEHENCSHCGGSGMEPADHNDDDYDMYDTDDDYDRGGDDESHYEKYVRTRGLEERMAEAAAWLSEAEPYTGIDPIVRQRMGMAPATQGEIQSYLDKNPPVVRSGSGAPVTSGSGAPVQSGGAVDVAKAADAVAKPPGFSAGPGISAATTTPTPVATPSVSTTKLPSQPPVTKPQPPSFSKGVSNIAAANKIADPNKISVGQTIKLPSGQSYTVAKGDTLSGIAAGNFKGATSTPTSTTKPTMPSGTPPKPLGPTPAASTAAPKPTTPTPAPKPTTPAPAPSASVPAAKNIYVPNVSGAGQKGPTVAAATGSDTTNPINKLNFGTGNSVPPTTMFNQLPKGSTGAITKETKGKEQPEADYGDDYQQMVLRLKKLAGAGPLKTVWDPAKRVYKNVPANKNDKK